MVKLFHGFMYGNAQLWTPKPTLPYFGYLKTKHDSEIQFDPSKPDIDDKSFGNQYWKVIVYCESREENNSNLPECCSFGFNMRAFFDSDHARESITRRSRTEFILYLTIVHNYWTSKKDTIIETIQVGSGFIATNQYCK